MELLTPPSWVDQFARADSHWDVWLFPDMEEDFE